MPATPGTPCGRRVGPRPCISLDTTTFLLVCGKRGHDTRFEAGAIDSTPQLRASFLQRTTVHAWGKKVKAADRLHPPPELQGLTVVVQPETGADLLVLYQRAQAFPEGR